MVPVFGSHITTVAFFRDEDAPPLDFRVTLTPRRVPAGARMMTAYVIITPGGGAPAGAGYKNEIRDGVFANKNQWPSTLCTVFPARTAHHEET